MEKVKVVSVTTRTRYVFTEEEIQTMLFEKIGVKKEFGDQCVFKVSGGGGYFDEAQVTVERTVEGEA